VRAGRWIGIGAASLLLGLLATNAPAGAGAQAQHAASGSHAFLHTLGKPTTVGSTVPANGDVNPYGVAVVPTSTGSLVAGDVLVSNFNSKANVQGTGTSIVQVAPGGRQQLFSDIAQLPAGMSCPGGIGLTTALDILPGGWVVVGSLPTGAAGALPKGVPTGCLLVLNSNGNVVETFSNPDIVGPWDMTAETTPSGVELFVANALGGNTKTDKGVPVAGLCTVVRLVLALSPTAPPALANSTVVGTDFPWKANKTALVLAPTGLALGKNGTLYVDNSLNNTVSAIRQAATRTQPVTAASSEISKGGSLDAPLGLITAPDGGLLVVNGNNGVATELNSAGKQVATNTLVKNGAGDLFGLASTPDGKGIYFVNDGANTLEEAQA
jgi:hypothetical protein